MIEHLLLFALVSLAVVTMGALYSEREDGAALRSVPRKLLVFLVSCGVVAAVMLVCEHFFASV